MTRTHSAAASGVSNVSSNDNRHARRQAGALAAAAFAVFLGACDSSITEPPGEQWSPTQPVPSECFEFAVTGTDCTEQLFQAESRSG